MSEDSSILEYLARGGKISAPDNAPPRYRAELMRMMASFVDSELAGAAGFADLINHGPGIKERIAASRIVLEKFDHAERVLQIMGDFGANTERYQKLHSWSQRVNRNDELGAERCGSDMRLNIFYYPIEGWTDAVVLNVLMGKATLVQLRELARSSYQPFAEAIEEIIPRERRHMELGEEGLLRMNSTDASARTQIEASIDYWRPRVAKTFGAMQSKRHEMLLSFGLRHRDNASLLADWKQSVDSFLAAAQV